MINPMDLTGKHILIDGASSGLGRQTCITVSRLGAKVSLVARNVDKMQETISAMEGEGHKAYRFDLNCVEEIEDLITNIVKDQGKIDGYVHSAGIGTLRPVGQTTYPFMCEMMRIHLFSFVEAVRIISKKKNCGECASIVAVSSGASTNSDKGKTAYTTAKGALDSVVRPLAIELGETKKIRVNTVNPGWIKTDMYHDYVKMFGPEKMEEQLKTHVLGAAEPEQIANVIAFLLSPASSNITGQSIFADSGWTIHG